MKSANLALRFGLELAMLAAFGFWGFAVYDAIWFWIAGFGAPLVIATIWGMWIAPKATRRLPDPTRLGIEIVLFTIAALCLATAGAPGYGLAFAALEAANLALLVLWRQR